jgi:hypothetical protein
MWSDTVEARTVLLVWWPCLCFLEQEGQMMRTRALLITGILAFCSTASADYAYAQADCTTKWMSCTVECSNKYGTFMGKKNDPMMERGCRDSCQASDRLCRDLAARELQRRRDSEERARRDDWQYRSRNARR